MKPPLPSTSDLRSYVQQRCAPVPTPGAVDEIVDTIQQRLVRLRNEPPRAGVPRDRGRVGGTRWSTSPTPPAIGERRHIPSRPAWTAEVRAIVDDVLREFASRPPASQLPERARLSLRRVPGTALEPTVDESWVQAAAVEARLDTSPHFDFDFDALDLTDDELTLLSREDAD